MVALWSGIYTSKDRGKDRPSMAPQSRLTIAKNDILSHFEHATQRVYSEKQLTTILDKQRAFWRLAQRTTTPLFISFLEKQGKLKARTLVAAGYGREITRYSWGEASMYELALSISPRGYLSHATAVALHALTDLIPKTLYLNVEQSPKPAPAGALTQHGIDQAFSREQRQSNMTYECDDWSVKIINGKNTHALGVEELVGPSQEPLRATNLERTLIDIVVRPAYAGGIFQVLEAYRTAMDRVSTNRLVATLKKLEYVYPYHQAIGFLMERAGYGETRCGMLRQLGLHFDFYLVHGLKQRQYSQEWRLHYPQGLQ
jgi:predicted transcriptional regulator of viral defense system